MDEKGDKNWHDFLAEFTYNYNHSVHCTIKKRPADVSEKNYNEVFLNLYGKWTAKILPPKFKIGDRVRVNRYKSTFEKVYEMSFHKEI